MKARLICKYPLINCYFKILKQTIRTHSTFVLQGEDEATINNVNDVLRYVWDYWFGVVTPTRFCVYNQPRKTNNDCEVANRWLAERVGVVTINLWSLIRKFLNC